MGRRLVVEADGGSRGNPGPAGYGALVRDAGTGELLAEEAESIGTATNNVAEYRGLIAGLEAAARIDPAARVEARMDSKLVVEQMSGRWKIKHPDLKPLARQADALVAGLGGVRFTWVPRADNADADRLANAAMDAAAGLGADAAAESGAVAPAAGEVAGAAAGPGAAHGPPDTEPTRLLLLRHGTTAHSVERRFAGVGDLGLTEQDRAQAEAAAQRIAGLGADAVVASPLRRTMETARTAAARLGLDVEPDPDLRETDFGAFEGMTFAEVRRERPAELAAWLSDVHAAPPGGESLAAAARRAGRARDALARRLRGRTVLVVSHVTPIKAMVAHALGAPVEALYRMHLDEAGLSEIDLYADGPAVLRSFNDTAHLR